MKRRQTSAAIIKALEQSQYSSVFVKDGSGCRLYFGYSDETVTICSPNPKCSCLLIAPDQADSNLIVVSTDAIRLPQEMDSDTIAERLIRMNDEGKKNGIYYNAYPYHGSEGFNRVVWVIKQYKAIEDKNVIDTLPKAIDDVLNATGSFMVKFNTLK